MSGYVVTAPLAVLTDQAGKLRYYYTGAVIPDDIPPAELTRFAQRGLIGPLTTPAAPDPAPDDSDEPPPPTGPSDTTTATDPERPAQVASKAIWVDYAAVARGMDRSAAEAMTKQELIAALQE